MSNLKNSVQLIGNVGQDPQTTNLENGNVVTNISVATNETYKDANGEKVTNTEWHNAVAWNKTAEIIDKYVKKGDQIAIEGKLVNRTFETKEGEKRSVTEIKIREVVLLSNKQGK